MRKLIKAILLLVFLLFLLVVILVFDLSPTVKANSSEQVGNAESVQVLISELRQSLRSRYDAQVVNINVDQADSLAGFIHRAVNQTNALVGFSDEQLTFTISYELNTGLLPLYLNLKTLINEGKGIDIQSVTLGDLRLPGDFALGVAENLANAYTDSEVATIAIESVDSMRIDKSGVSVQLNPLDSLLRELKNIKTGGGREDVKVLKIRIAHYLRLLDSLYVPPSVSKKEGPSLSYYLHALMQEAQVLSQQSSATLENEAAILALAIYAGSGRFTTLIGDLSFAIERVPYASPKPTLVGRQDLSLHFIFSAAIKLLSQKGISIAVGEFKELMDRGSGGSGYSFVDLAADLSGAHFADIAVNPESAEFLQAMMATQADESLFIVSIAGLEEGLSKADFERKYTQVDSQKYKAVVSTINERIAQLPISN